MMETTTIANDKWRLPVLGVLLVLVTLVSGVVMSIAPIYAALLVPLAVGGLIFVGLLQRPQLVLYGTALFMPYIAEVYVAQLAGARLTPLTVFVALLLAVLGSRILALGRFHWIPSGVRWGMFVLVSLMSFAMGPQITGLVQGIWALYRLVIVACFPYFAVCYLLRSTESAKRVLKILAFSASIAGVTSIVQVVSGGKLLSGLMTNQRYLGLFQPIPPEIVESYSVNMRHKLYLAGTDIYRGHGTFFAANYFGAFVGVTACITWGLFRGMRGWRRWAWGLLLALQIGGSVATFSRSAWAAIIAGLVISVLGELWLTGKGRIIERVFRVALLMVPVLLIVLVIALQIEGVGEHFFTLLMPWKATTFQWRLLVWRLSIDHILTHPLGAGSPTIVDVPAYFSNRRFSAHNLFLSVAYTNGLIVFVLFLTFVWQWLHSAWHLAKHSQSAADRLLGLGILGSGWAFLVAGVGSSLMTIESLAVLFWFMLGIITVMKRQGIHRMDVKSQDN
jgi:hypothetical protein